MNMILLYLFPFFSATGDTSYAIVHLDVEGQNKNFISINVPLLNNNIMLKNYTKNNVVLDGENIFDFKIPLSTSSFFTIDINNEERIPLVLTINDSVSIIAERNSHSGRINYNLKITGSNSFAHNIYQQTFYPPGKNYFPFEIFSKNSKNLNAYYLQSKKYIDSLLVIWDSLKNNKLISNDAYTLYVADTKASLYDEAIRKLSKARKLDSGLNSSLRNQIVKNVMFYHADASNPLLLKTFAGEYLYQLYLKNILEEDDNIKDTLLKNADLGFYYYYDSSYRELAWGSYLYYLKTLFPSLDVSSTNVEIKAFRKYYPNSRFLFEISKFQDSLISNRKALNIPIALDTVVYKSMKDLLSSITGNYIFIDVWATWCTPCVQEFSYLPDLDRFLQEKNIKQAYLSIDKESERNKWESFINKNYIPGYHFIISENVQNELLKILAQKEGETALFIPRYLLYSKNTDRFYIDLPHPSTGIVLKSIISEILNKQMISQHQ